MYRWPPSTSGSLTSCAKSGRCSNEGGPSDQNGVAGESERTAPAGDACLFRAGGATGGEGDSELRAILTGASRARVRCPPAESHRQATARVGVAAREDAGELRAETPSCQGRAGADGRV